MVTNRNLRRETKQNEFKQEQKCSIAQRTKFLVKRDESKNKNNRKTRREKLTQLRNLHTFAEYKEEKVCPTPFLPFPSPSPSLPPTTFDAVDILDFFYTDICKGRGKRPPRTSPFVLQVHKVIT